MAFYDIRFFPEDNFCVAAAQVETTSMYEITMQSFHDVFGSDKWVKGMNVLWDVRSLKTISEVDYNAVFSHVETFYKKLGGNIGNGRRAFLASTPVVYGVYRRWEILSGRENVLRTFMSLDEALEWLGVTNEEKYGLR